MGILENRAKLREQILEAIEALTGREIEITLSSLAKLCGCTKKTLYNVHLHFIKKNAGNFVSNTRTKNSAIEGTTQRQREKLKEYRGISGKAFGIGIEPESSYWSR